MESGTIQSQAAIIREFVAHPGMKLLVDRIQSKIGAKQNAWLNAKSEEAEQIRQDARCYAALMGTLNEFLLRAKADDAKAQA